MRLLECLGGSQEVRPCGMRWIQRAAAAQQAPRARDGQRLHRSPQRARQSGPHALASEVAAANAERSSALGCKPGGRGEGGCTRERREERDDDGDRDRDGELGLAGGNCGTDSRSTSSVYLISIYQFLGIAPSWPNIEETPFFCWNWDGLWRCRRCSLVPAANIWKTSKQHRRRRHLEGSRGRCARRRASAAEDGLG